MVAITVNGEGLPPDFLHRRGSQGGQGRLESLPEPSQGTQPVELIISDACLGPVESAAEYLPQACWQRCMVGSLKKSKFADSLVVEALRSVEHNMLGCKERGQMELFISGSLRQLILMTMCWFALTAFSNCRGRGRRSPRNFDHTAGGRARVDRGSGLFRTQGTRTAMFQRRVHRTAAGFSLASSAEAVNMPTFELAFDDDWSAYG